ncbi:hypothetical protein PR202_gb06150 [Eleusine coracana subsp. coracana]|uniref:Uncharacterized protein n=1 Tax=Eleusine coracana subsp. coracana TaxID=191504 RepID=A0AAV5E956_ELECO|nr:hypothetical protein PR202_gb06150 [Eleusine coracana subsp. coracana]
MAGKKRAPVLEAETATDASRDEAAEAPAKKKKLAMERKKQRKELDKERHRQSAESDAAAVKPQPPPAEAAAPVPVSPPPVLAAAGPGLHMNVFRDLASPEAPVREAAAEALVAELKEVQKAHEKSVRKGEKEAGAGDGPTQMEAEKDDGLENCAPSVRYAIRRLIRGISSSREFARQGFALGLAVVLESIRSIRVEAIMKLIPTLLEYSSSMKGPEAKDNLLGRLFGFGSLVRSGQISRQWSRDKSSPVVKDFVSEVVKLGSKKRYLAEPAVAVILDLVRKLPDEAIISEVLEVPVVQDWFTRAAADGDPDALFLALKLQQRTNAQKEIFGSLLPYPFSPDTFFTKEHLQSIAACFKESAFSLPRIHSLWLLITEMLIREAESLNDTNTNSGKKHKKNKKASSSEDTNKNLCNFCEVVIEESLLLSSHDRKNLAFNILLSLLPKLSPSAIQVVLSSKVVHGLMDILSNESSWLFNAGKHFLTELVNVVSQDNDRRDAVIINLQKYSNGRFDCMTKTKVVKELVSKFRSGQDCLCLVQNLMVLFVDEESVTDEPSDQSQTTDENSELGPAEDQDSFGQGNADLLKNWVVNTIPSVLKNLKLPSKGSDAEMAKCIEEKFQVQTEILKFLAVQGLFSASLGTEVTSFELQEKFKWPKTPISTSLRNECIEQLQFLLEDAEKDEALHVANEATSNDLGFYFMRFINTVCNIPSVSLFRMLSSNDDNAFKQSLAMESMLFQEERKAGPGLDSTKMHAMRYLLIQLLLQVLLHPDDYWEAAVDVTICCKKSFPAIAQGDNSTEQESSGHGSADSDEDGQEESNEEVSLEFMDVLVQTFLSILPHVSGPMCFTIEQANGMDDDAMFRIDPYIARIFKERNLPGSETKQSQLMRFKLRVLTLLEIYLQRNSGNSQVVEVYSNLMRAFVKSHGADGSKQFKERIGGILQKRIFKEREYPRGNDIEFTKLESLLTKALRLASRSRFKIVASMAQNASFWILKIISSKNCSEEELASVVDKFRSMLTDYFNNKKSRLKLGFVKEVVRRNLWIGRDLFGFLLQEIGGTKAEYRRTQTLELLDCILKSWVGDAAGAAEALTEHLAQLCELIQEILSNIPENKLRRKEVRKFCTGVLQTVSKLNLKEQFQNTLSPEANSLCQTHLGAAFSSFQN